MLKALGEYGKMRQYMNSIMGLLVGLMFLVAGIFMERKRAKHDLAVSARVKSVGKCSLVTRKDASGKSLPSTYSCMGVKVEYVDPKGVRHSPGPMIVESSNATSPGGSMTLYLNRKNFSDFSRTSDSTTVPGIIAIVSGLFVIVWAIGSAFFVTKSKVAADVSGVEGIADAVSQVI